MPTPTARALDAAWERISALGGRTTPDDKRGQGVNWAVERALAIIEDLGGLGPKHRECDCGAETTGKWADIHSPGCASIRPMMDGQ